MGKKREKSDRGEASRSTTALEGDRKGGQDSKLAGKRELIKETKEDKLDKQRADWEGMTP